MPKRTYGELCPIARSLDVIGERWTLLIVRELLLGPKRFKDLLAALTAMGTNRLAERLKSLEADGVIAKQTLPAPAGVQVYALTELGERLRPAVVCLGAFGSHLPIDARIRPETARAEVLALGLAGAAPSAALSGVREIHDFRIGQERFHLLIDDGTVTPRSGAPPVRPDLVVECELDTFLALLTRNLTPARAVRERRARIDGPREASRRAFKILNLQRALAPIRLAAA
jgi:DNA-binding HxlR family transcriptional regulator